MSEVVEPAPVPVLAPIPPMENTEFYFAGDEGWSTSCIPELGETVGSGIFGYGVGAAAYEVINTFVGNPENFGNYSAANKAGLVFSAVAVVACLRRIVQDSRNSAGGMRRTEGEENYAVLAGGRVRKKKAPEPQN